MTISQKPARLRFFRWNSISALPPARSNGLGTASVNGRMRSPRPAARIIALNDSFSESVAGIRVRRLGALPFIKQREQRFQLAVAFASLAQILLHQREVVKICAFAVAVVKAGEYRQNLYMALHAHPFEVAVEVRKILRQRQPELPRLLPVTDHPVQYPLLVPADVRILE